MPKKDHVPTRSDDSPVLTRELLEQNQRIYVDVVAKYYGDPDFRDRMDADPTATTKAEGLAIPDNAKVRLLFNSERLLHVVLPVLPKEISG